VIITALRVCGMPDSGSVRTSEVTAMWRFTRMVNGLSRVVLDCLEDTLREVRPRRGQGTPGVIIKKQEGGSSQRTLWPVDLKISHFWAPEGK
jgi:hypothetical protein